MANAHEPPHRRFSEERVVIMSAPNGARRMPADHPKLPLQPNELAECAASLLENAVSVLHMHVRDENYRHTLDADRYRAATAAVKSTTGDELIVQITTEAVGRFPPDRQMAAVRELRLEAVSLALRELVPDEASETDAARFFEWLGKERIWPQYILYSADDVVRFDDLRQRGLLAADHPFCMLVLGQYAAGRDGTIDDLDAMLAELDRGRYPWSVCCFGSKEHDAALHAASLGGHVRLGFENNVLLNDGSVARDNAALIRQFNDARIDSRRRPATANEIRERWLVT